MFKRNYSACSKEIGVPIQKFDNYSRLSVQHNMCMEKGMGRAIRSFDEHEILHFIMNKMFTLQVPKIKRKVARP
jgi:hypothetical protein